MSVPGEGTGPNTWLALAVTDNVSVKALVRLAPVGNLEVGLAAVLTWTLVVLHVGVHGDNVALRV